MAKLRRNLKRTAAIVLSSLTALSAMSSLTALSSLAVSYSEMSALDQYAYSGNDLGAVYSKSSTTFKVWAPTASDVKLKRYKTGSDSESGAGVIETKAMTKQSQGIWSVTVSGDLAGTYYTYLVTVNGTTRETVDIYAKSTGVNGKRGMVIDLDSTDPAGWENDKRISCPNQTDAVIWEAHVRDFSASSDSGMVNKGKYLAFTETGTTVNNDGVHPTGIDYLEDLGITHVHLLPVYDYGSVDETKLNTDQFNWGYDPMNYNTPEGSYSTNPYDGNVRVNEFKRMVQSLHNKGIGVVMDVVYNHTYAGSSNINDWFNYTVPDYYYRQSSTGKLSNASGCGNETASDRAMYQKFMIDSLTYWATEYHLDGFRFDLMGIHDCETMNKIREAMDKIDPQIILYGEPWTAEATPCPKPTAVQGNMGLVSEEVAAFNDKVRDAIKGSCFNAADKGFIQGAPGFETALKGGIQANSTTMGNQKWSKQPSQTVTYTSAHDNYTLYDKLVKSCYGGSGYGQRRDDLAAMNKMAGGIILTSQGMSFFQAGEEFARSKGGDENSYKSPTSVNQLTWQNTITFSDVAAYYKGLIEIRKAYAPFRDPTNTSNGTIYFSWGDNCPANVVGFTMYNKGAPSGEWNFAAVIHNANSSSKQVKLMTYDGVTLPSQWVIIADGTTAGTKSLGTSGSTVTVPARSTMVLIDKTSFDSTSLSAKGTVNVRHINKTDNSVLSTETLKGDIGKSYQTSASSSLLQNGYKLLSDSGNTSGTFTKEPVTVNYYYELDSSKYGTVTVEYIDAETGEKLTEDKTLSGLIGSSVTVTADKSFTGYLTPDFSKSVTFEAAPSKVTISYTKKEETGLKIHYYNSSSWANVYMYVYTGSGNSAVLHTGSWPGSAMTSEGGGWYSGTVESVDSALFIANNKGAGSQDPSGDRPDGYPVSGECWVKNKNVYPTGTVKVTYQDTKGNILGRDTLKGMADGTNTYRTDAKTFDDYILSSSSGSTEGIFKEGVTEVIYYYTYTGASEPFANTSTISKTSIALGSSVTLNGSAVDGNPPYKFTYRYKKSGASSWTNIGTAKTSSTSAVFTPDEAGTYELQVIAYDTSSNDTKSFTLNVTSVPSGLVNNSTISKTSALPNESVKLTAKASGGNAPYTYTYRYRKTGTTSWKYLGSANVTSSTKSFSLSTEGSYEAAVLIKDSDGTVKSKTFNLTIGSSSGFTNNSTISKTSAKTGETVKLTASASGGSAPYTYSYRCRKRGSSSWKYIGSTNVSAAKKSFSLSTAGTYDVAVLIKDSTGTVKSKTFTLVISSSNELVNSSSISKTSATAGENITLTAKASGGNAPYTYTYRYRKSGSSSWKYIGSSNVSTTSKSFSIGTEGTYEVAVLVKESSGTVKSKTFTLTIGSVSGLVNYSTISKTTVSLGSKITITAKAEGGTAPYYYTIQYKMSSASTWSTIGSRNSSNTTAYFTPTSASAYNIRVIIKDDDGAAAAKNFTLTCTA